MMTNSKPLCNILLLTMLGELSAVTREMITCTYNKLLSNIIVISNNTIKYTGGTFASSSVGC